MNYNSQKESLVMPQYGRNVQNLIQHAKGIEDNEEKQKYMNRIIELMLQMNPQSKNLLEYKEKLWKHAFQIAEFDLAGVLPPNGILPEPEESTFKEELMSYPVELRSFRHYGKNIRTMMDKAIVMEEGEKKNAFTIVIASYMKLAYQTWNINAHVNDEMILGDLKKMSNDQLVVGDGESLDALISSAPPPRKNRKPQKGGKNNRGKKNTNNRHKRRR